MHTLWGGNGTIGSVLAKELAAYPGKIRIVGRKPKKINDTDELFPADLSNVSEVENAVAGSTIVYLLVGFDYSAKVWRERWPALMRATIDACKKHHAKLVFFDNVYVYDLNAIGHMTEQSPMNAPSEKGKVRMEIAKMILTEIAQGSLNAMIVRSADFYGPNNEKSFLLEVVYKNILKGKKPNWFMAADKKHSFTYTPDAARATAILANTPDAYNQVWHLPTDKNSLTGRQMADLFSKEMNGKGGISILPKWLLKILGLFIPIMKEMPEMMYQYDRDYFFDSSKFDQRFDFVTTPYAKGVKETVALTKK